MASTAEKLEDLNLTQDEIERLSEAFKKDEFKKLFMEYAEEISDPENRARYESEIRQMENERGMDVKFINPQPGYVIKSTVGGNIKAFINVCTNNFIGKPSSTKQVGRDGQHGLSWSLPHSFSPPREDFDNRKTKCQVYDFVIHPDTYRMAESNARFKKMVTDLAVEGICKQFSVELDLKNLRFPKMKYKGMPTATVMRTKLPENDTRRKNRDPDDVLNSFPYPYNSQTTDENSLQKQKEVNDKKNKEKQLPTKRETVKNNVETDTEHTVPKYSIRHRSVIDMQDFVDSPDANRSTRPKALIIDICLPLLSSAATIQLDIFEKHLKLVSDKPAKYKLDISLPYPVDENQGEAKFDKVQRKLIVTLPVMPAPNDDFRKSETISSEISQSPDEGISDNLLKLSSHDTPKPPLIEVISSQDIDVATAVCENVTSGDQICEAEVSAIDPVEENNSSSKKRLKTTASAIFDSLQVDFDCKLPEYECVQDMETFTFVFFVNGVNQEYVILSDARNHSCHLKMISYGHGSFPDLYSCCIVFRDECMVVDNGWTCISSSGKVSLSVIKDKSSRGIWKDYLIGTDFEFLEERTLGSAQTNESFGSSQPCKSDVQEEDSIYQSPPDNTGIEGQGVAPEMSDTSDEENLHESNAGLGRFDHKLKEVQNHSLLISSNHTHQRDHSTGSNGSEITIFDKLNCSGLNGHDDTESAEIDHSGLDDHCHTATSATLSAGHTTKLAKSSDISNSTRSIASSVEQIGAVRKSREHSETKSSAAVDHQATNKTPVASYQPPQLVEIPVASSQAPQLVETPVASSQPPQLVEDCKPETILSWKDDARVSSGDSQQCSIGFTNSVMFELDVE